MSLTFILDSIISDNPVRKLKDYLWGFSPALTIESENGNAITCEGKKGDAKYDPYRTIVLQRDDVEKLIKYLQDYLEKTNE